MYICIYICNVTVCCSVLQRTHAQIFETLWTSHPYSPQYPHKSSESVTFSSRPGLRTVCVCHVIMCVSHHTMIPAFFEICM